MHPALPRVNNLHETMIQTVKVMLLFSSRVTDTDSLITRSTPTGKNAASTRTAAAGVNEWLRT